MLGWAGLIAASMSCASTDATRPQLLVEVSTDLLPIDLVGQRPLFSESGTVDTLRVDFVGKEGVVREFREFAVGGDDAWPVSFGVPDLGPDASLRFRFRLFRGADATGARLDARNVVEPNPAVAIDRVVDLPTPVQGISRVRIALAGACLGRLPSFLGSGSTCVDAEHLQAAFSDGVGLGPGAKLGVGTFAAAQERPCEGEAPAGALCIPGGMMIMGSEGLARLAAPNVQTIPLRTVAVSAFFMDRTEYTVGRYLAAVRSAGAVSTPPLAGSDAQGVPCTLSTAASAKDLALSCVTSKTAATMCAREGGRLPSEAEWEFAAQGRGQRRIFPWGNALAACCTAALDQFLAPGVKPTCPVAPLGPVAGHVDPQRCVDAVDVSRDGVADLGGSLGELTSDTLVPYGYAGAAGVEVDPRTAQQGLGVLRGGDFTTSRPAAAVALRRADAGGASAVVGFRCVYGGAAP